MAFLKEFARANQKKVSGFTNDTMDILLQYRWPGNVRELRTAIESALVLSRGEKITPRDLPHWVRNAISPAIGTSLAEKSEMTVKDAEKQLIIRALKETNGNRTLAARKIGISRRSFHRKLHQYKLEDY
jgi:DNA-binding NtrC family response regulator